MINKSIAVVKTEKDKIIGISADRLIYCINYKGDGPHIFYITSIDEIDEYTTLEDAIDILEIASKFRSEYCYVDHLDKFVLTEEQVQDNKITLSYLPVKIKRIIVTLWGLILSEGDDYTIEGKDISFICDIEVNDQISVYYQTK